MKIETKFNVGDHIECDAKLERPGLDPYTVSHRFTVDEIRIKVGRSGNEVEYRGTGAGGSVHRSTEANVRKALTKSEELADIFAEIFRNGSYNRSSVISVIESIYGKEDD